MKPLYPFVMLACIALTPTAGFAEQNYYISVAPVYTFYKPQLGDLNQGLFNAPLLGTAVTLDNYGAPVTHAFQIHNNVPAFDYGNGRGIELKAHLTPNLALVFGISKWDDRTSSTVTTPFTLKRHPNQAQFSRSIALGIEETYLGIQHSFIENQKMHGFWRLAWHDFSDIYLQEKLDFSFTSGPQAGESRFFYHSSTGNSASAMEIGLGLDYFIRPWLSVSANAGRMVGRASSKLGSAHYIEGFTPADDVYLILPAIAGIENQALKYQDINGNYHDIVLNFGGWKSSVNINFYF
jgi:hypothetical protein